MKYHQWTKSEEALLRQLFNERLDDIEIAGKMNITPSQVTAFRRRKKIARLIDTSHEAEMNRVYCKRYYWKKKHIKMLYERKIQL